MIRATIAVSLVIGLVVGCSELKIRDPLKAFDEANHAYGQALRWSEFVVAATFLAGLSLGSYLFGRFSDRSNRLLVIYAAIELAIALFALLFKPTLDIINNLHYFLDYRLPDHVLFTQSIHLIISAILLLPPTICMGGTFPLMCRFFARSKSGGQIGRLYAVNTLGAAVGAFSCGYLLIPEIGLFFTKE